MKPKDVSGLDATFGPKRIKDFLPAYNTLPEEFRCERDPWCHYVQMLFFKGGDLRDLKAKPGIDKGKAIAHIRTCLVSFEPKHEHKIAGCAWLFDQWFERPESLAKSKVA